MAEFTLEERLQSIEEKVKLIETQLKSESIESKVYEKDFVLLVKSKLMDIVNMDIVKVEYKLESYQLARVHYPVKILNNSPKMRIRSNAVLAVMGFKFIEGDGWGTYRTFRGVVDLERTFRKYKSGVISGNILNNFIILYADDVFEIKRDSGEGEVIVEVMGIEVKPAYSGEAVQFI